MAQLLDTVRRVFGHGGDAAVARPAAGLDTLCGLETRTDPAAYRWHGLRRGADPRHPAALFQYTLKGAGVFVERGTAKPVGPGHAFLAILPSEHEYYLPAGETGAAGRPEWVFFWLMVSHPFAVGRLAECVRQAGHVWAAAEDSLLVSKAVTLATGLAAAPFRDRFAYELALFDFTLEFQRLADRLAYHPTQREALLSQTRAYVLERLHRQVGVEELAGREGMSRSHYSHHFVRTTGWSPARFISETRLARVAALLRDTDRTLEAIARETGFADANHLCKAFRRRHHLSPGRFRKQMR